MGSRRFAVRLAMRLALLLTSAIATAALLAFGRAPTAALLAALGVVGAAVGLWRLVSEGNAELARFVTALERGDLAQSFRWQGRGAGFDALGSAYERALTRLRAERASGAGTARLAEAMLDGAPTPLLLIGPGDELRLANVAARRLFGRADAASIDALAGAGEPFVAALRAATPGPTRIAPLLVDGLAQRVALDTTQVEIDGIRRRVVAIKPIQGELDGAELAAQSDLVRVLTHEVMNSLTPVTSLAASATRLVGGIDPAAAPGLADAQLALAALARRAAELERFVTSYKGFSEAPPLSRAPIMVAPWLEGVARLFANTPGAADVSIAISVAPDTPAIDGDEGLLTQVLLNLLKNAGEAAASGPEPAIALIAGPSADGRVRVAVADNGPGIPEELAREVFLPFFTTKPAGTGIGLSLARQLVLLHGGQIGIGAGAGGRVEMLLPKMR